MLTARTLRVMRNYVDPFGSGLGAILALAGPAGRTDPTRGLMGSLFPAQRRFCEDPSRFKVALCGRRAGKTEGVARWLLVGALLRPGSVQLYIALSQRNARRILWATLQRVARDAGIDARPNEQTLELSLPNGSRIWVSGCPDVAQCEDFRGHKLFRVAIDEAGSFPEWLEYLVEDVLSPTLMDLRGEIALVGTPGLTPIGYFYDRTDGDKPWPVHRWTCLDNPHVPGAEEIERLTRENGWAPDHPTLVREWLGRWVRDESALVYPFNPTLNLGVMPDAEEPRSVFRVLAVDPGFSPDPTGFVVAANIAKTPELYIERAWRRSGLTVAGIAGQIEQARRDLSIHAVVVDEGGLGKMIAASLRENHGVACEAAQKSAKLTAIHEFRGAMLSGQIKIDSMTCQELLAEWTTCAWNQDRTDHDERCPDDLCDPSLYAFRRARVWYQPEQAPPAQGTPEWHAEYRRKRLAELQRDMKKKRRTA